jgi:[ribosomal protein S5]-alanine N-acetyltransferase
MKRIELVLRTRQEVLRELEAMSPEDREQVSPVWIARISDPGQVDPWSLGFSIVELSTGAEVGSCGFKAPPDERRTVEIAYGIRPEYQGQGFATEAARAMVEYAVQSSEVRKVIAHTLPEKNASGWVLTKCGFQCLGEVIDPEDGLVWRWERVIG